VGKSIKKLKTSIICISILSTIIILFTFFEFIALKILGLKYDSLSNLFLFLIIYGFLEIPLNLFLSSIMKALKATKILNSSKGLLRFLVNIIGTFILLNIIDIYMDSISITQFGILVFSVITGLIGWLSIQDDAEPPNYDTKEYNNIDKKFKDI